MNSNGLDEYIVDKCYSQAQQARKLHSITTFMIANDPYLQQFVNKFTEANQGKALHRTERTGRDDLRIMKRIKKRELNGK
jgi:uncharacterized protein with von Willebrand factor type A (vWA) domain